MASDPDPGVCDMCLRTLGLQYVHDIEDCPLQAIADEQGPVPHFECRLCSSARDCPLHPCPFCKGEHVRSVCTSFELLEEPVLSQLRACLHAQYMRRSQEDAEWACIRANDEHEARVRDGESD
jgi:hypothetical protein